jgi:catechol 2,3-dioxygenase-like lactoylglutathione lyase family enzyme
VQQRVSIVTPGVADLERSREFYERLGWLRELPRDAFSGVSLSYDACSREEVDSALAEPEAPGAALLKPAREAFWGGYAGCFTEDGGIQIPD